MQKNQHSTCFVTEDRCELRAKLFGPVMTKDFVGRHGSKIFQFLVKPQLKALVKHQISGNRHQKRDFGEINS